MIACVRAFVSVTPQETCRQAGPRDRKESITGSASPGWRPTASQSIVRPSSLGGVPVFSRPSGRASSSIRSASRTAAASPSRPAGRVSSPMWITPRRKVPVVSTTAPARTTLRHPASRTPADDAAFHYKINDFPLDNLARPGAAETPPGPPRGIARGPPAPAAPAPPAPCSG